MIDKSQIIETFQAAGLVPGDVVFTHTNLALFGPIVGVSSAEDLYRFWLTLLSDFLEEDGVLVLPAFTYSFNSNDDKGYFDLNQKPVFPGMSNYALTSKLKYARSMDPMLSVMCFGARAEEFVKDIDKNCFGVQSIWARLLANNAKLVNLNLDSASTFLHYVEYVAKVKYRSEILMTGKIKFEDETVSRSEIIYFGRSKLDDETTLENFKDYHLLATKMGINRRLKLGRGVINVSKFTEILEFTLHQIKKDPNFLIKGHV